MLDTSPVFEQKIRTLPLLPLRNLAALPKQTIHLDVARKLSASAVSAALAADRYIFLATQMDITEEEPRPEGIFTYGTVAKVKQMMKAQNGDLRVMLDVLCRAQAITVPYKDKGYYNVTVSLIPELPMPIQSDSS